MRQGAVPQADEAASAAVHGAPDGVGGGAGERRGALPFDAWHAVPAPLRRHRPQDPLASFPSFCSRLHPSFRPSSRHRRGALRLFHLHSARERTHKSRVTWQTERLPRVW